MTTVTRPSDRPAHSRACDVRAGDVWPPLPDEARGQVEQRIADVLHTVASPLARTADVGAPHPAALSLPAALTLWTATLAGDTLADGAGRAASAGAAVELLHRAALTHDDGVDGRRRLRSVPTDGARYTGVTGDLLIAASLTAAAEFGSFATAELARALAEVRAASQQEERLRFDTLAGPDDALAVARGGTAALLRAACVVGAAAAGLPLEQQRVLGGFGAAFGVLVHVVDDVLDLVSTPELLGRPAGLDLAAGRMTLPICHALRLRPELADLLGPAATADDLRAAHVLVLRSGALAASMRTVALHVDACTDALRRLGAVPGADPSALPRFAAVPSRYLDRAAERVVPGLRLLLHCSLDDTGAADGDVVRSKPDGRVVRLRP